MPCQPRGAAAPPAPPPGSRSWWVLMGASRVHATLASFQWPSSCPVRHVWSMSRGNQLSRPVSVQQDGGGRRSFRLQAAAEDPDAILAAKLQAKMDAVRSLCHHDQCPPTVTHKLLSFLGGAKKRAAAPVGPHARVHAGATDLLALGSSWTNCCCL